MLLACECSAKVQFTAKQFTATFRVVADDDFRSVCDVMTNNFLTLSEHSAWALCLTGDDGQLPLGMIEGKSAIWEWRWCL